MLVETLTAAVPPNVREVCAKLQRAGHEALTVGGAVRDAILGRIPGDWDVATSALPEQVLALFPHCIPTGLQHGTVTIVTGRGEASHVEVTTFRGEGEYTDARRPDHVVFGVPLERDLARRDLRVNAMAFDPGSGALVDPFGGQRDIADRLLRAVGNSGDVYTDAVGRFTEDGLRVMRAVRFASQLEFALDPETARGIGPALPSLARVSRERVCEELRKILATREPSRALAAARTTGILRTIAPALDAAIAEAMVPRWLARIDRCAEPARLAAMFAELAPAGGRRVDRALAKRVEDLLRDLKFSNDELRIAAPLVGSAGAMAERDWTEAQARRLLADLGRDLAPIALALWHDTRIATIAEPIVARRDPIAANELAISGKDVIADGVPAGPKIGKILVALLDRVLDDPAHNTRDGLLALARQLSSA